jgi:hypothetical protein
MPKIRDLLVCVSVETVPGQRKCHRLRKHTIAKGSACLVVRDPASGGYKNYCPECASPILDQVGLKVERLRRGLSLR